MHRSTGFFFQHFAAGGNQEFSAHENMRLQLWVHSVVDGALGGLAGFHGVSHEVGRPVHRSNINKVWNLHGGKKKRKKNDIQLTVVWTYLDTAVKVPHVSMAGNIYV